MSHLRSIMLLLVCLLLAGTVAAQEFDGTLTGTQPQIGQIDAAGSTLVYQYVVTDPRLIALQGISETAQPTLTIRQGGAVVAEQPNAAGSLIASLNAFVSAGTYEIEVGTANGTTGTVVLALLSETPIPAVDLVSGVSVSGDVNGAAPGSLYRFTALQEPAYLYIDSTLETGGATARLVNTTTGRVSGMLSGDLTGARFRIPAGTAAYQLEVQFSGGANVSEPFTVCFAPVSIGGCDGVEALSAQTAGECTVTPIGSAVNIRQSASTNAIIRGSLPAGSSAPVAGISPDGLFYNILFNGVDGWVSTGVVTSAGNCAGLSFINPPAVQLQPTLPPTGLPPTATVLPLPTVPPTQSGPCLIRINAPTNVYVRPNADISDLQDQIGMGGELIPNGRLADNSWWRTNYASSWIQTSTFGVTVTVTGDCSGLPVVPPPP